MTTRITFTDGSVLYVYPGQGEVADGRLVSWGGEGPCVVHEIPVVRNFHGWSAPIKELIAEAQRLTPEQVLAAPVTYSTIRSPEGRALYVFWGVEETITDTSDRFPLQKDGKVKEIAYRSGHVEAESWEWKV